MILDEIKDSFSDKLCKRIILICLLVVLITYIILQVVLGIHYSNVKYNELPEQMKQFLFWRILFK